jgi:hypothetical protein
VQPERAADAAVCGLGGRTTKPWAVLSSRCPCPQGLYDVRLWPVSVDLAGADRRGLPPAMTALADLIGGFAALLKPGEDNDVKLTGWITAAHAVDLSVTFADAGHSPTLISADRRA